MEFLTPKQVAELLQCRLEHVYSWVNSGKLKACDISETAAGRPRWRINRTDLDAFLESRRNPQPRVYRPRRRRSAPSAIDGWTNPY